MPPSPGAIPRTYDGVLISRGHMRLLAESPPPLAERTADFGIFRFAACRRHAANASRSGRQKVVERHRYAGERAACFL